jgi:hypothetical protein
VDDFEEGVFIILARGIAQHAQRLVLRVAARGRARREVEKGLDQSGTSRRVGPRLRSGQAGQRRPYIHAARPPSHGRGEGARFLHTDGIHIRGAEEKRLEFGYR